MSAAEAEQAARQCAGRFCMTIPASMRRTSERFAMRDVELKEVAFSPAGAEAFSRAWKAKLAQIDALKADREIPSDQNGEILVKRTLKPGSFEGALYYATDSAYVTFGALLGASPERGLWLEELFSKSHAEQVIADVGEIGLSYRLRPPKEEPWPLPGKDWFHLAHGAVALPFKESERIQCGFEGHPLKVKLSIETKGVDVPEKKGLARKFSEALGAAGAQFAGALSPVKQRGRAAAGLEGEEMVMRDVDGKRLYFMWSFPGEPRSGTKPRVILKMETRDEHLEEKMALWDRLVDSLAPAGR